MCVINTAREQCKVFSVSSESLSKRAMWTRVCAHVLMCTGNSQAIMEEIAGFEERLAGLKERGDELTSGCTERLQARLRQQIQSHLQGARDSYSAICSTAQRVSVPASGLAPRQHAIRSHLDTVFRHHTVHVHTVPSDPKLSWVTYSDSVTWSKWTRGKFLVFRVGLHTCSSRVSELFVRVIKITCVYRTSRLRDGVFNRLYSNTFKHKHSPFKTKTIRDGTSSCAN